MEYLQYLEIRKAYFLEAFVLNLIINGIPSIQKKQATELNMVL